MATQSPTPPVSGELTKAESELSQSLSSIGSVKNKKKKGNRKKYHSLDTPNFSKLEPEDSGRTSRNSENITRHQRTKPVQQSLTGIQVCARSCRDGLFYPGVVLKHTDSKQVLVQFADGQTDRVNARFVVPRGGALPCPVLHPGDYVLVRVRSKYGQHPNLSTGQCDYFIPAIVQVTPYKGGMTFPPASVPVYSAVSFNGRPVTSLRAGMVRIPRSFFLAVCRYIQELMMEMSAAMERGEESERHPALFGGTEADLSLEELRVTKSPSVETLSKLVEKQNEQHQELMDKLSQVISLSLPGSATEPSPAHDSVTPGPAATPSPPPISPRESQSLIMSPEPLSPAPPPRPFSAPSFTQTDTPPVLVEQGTQKTCVQDNWTESLPHTTSQGTSTQLDEFQPAPDTRLDSIESCQKRLLEELEGVSRGVSSLREEREAPANAYLVVQPDGQTVLVPRQEDTHVESAEEEQSKSTHQPGLTLKIEDLTPQPVASPASSVFSRGERVLVNSREDGWFYAGEVVEQHGEGGYVVRVKVSGDNLLVPMDRILPLLSSNRRLPEVYAEQRVLAEHPSYPGCYAPGVILHLAEETGDTTVSFYDDMVCEVQWGRVQPVEAGVCTALSELAAHCDNSWMTERVVSRRDHSGVFYTGQVLGKSWKTRHYMIQYSDGAIEEQSLAHIFRAPDGEEQGVVEGGYVLASPDTGLFMPGEVVGKEEGRAVVRFCHGEEKEVEFGEMIAISRTRYQDMFLYISQQQEEGGTNI